jgi:membrane protease YdiL (CAAX protease family)
MTLASGHPTSNPLSRPSLSRLGPPIALAAAVLVTFSIVAVAPTTLPGGGSAVAIATLLFLMASATALVAWVNRRSPRGSGLTYWDVAGALTFIGICVASTVEPNEMVALIEAADRRP